MKGRRSEVGENSVKEGKGVNVGSRQLFAGIINEKKFSHPSEKSLTHNPTLDVLQIYFKRGNEEENDSCTDT